MGIVTDLWIEESGKIAREAERKYNRLMNNHPYLRKTSELTEAVLPPNKSSKEEFDDILEPGIEGFESLGEALDSTYDENALDTLEEDRYYDR